MSASPAAITRGDLHPDSTPLPAARVLLPKPVFRAASSLLSLAWFALVATALRSPYGLATALLGFAGYVFLMSKALQCLPFNWHFSSHRRKPAQPPPPRGKLVPFGRGLPAVGPDVPIERETLQSLRHQEDVAGESQE